MKSDLDSIKTHVSRLTSSKYYDSTMNQVRLDIEGIDTLSDLVPSDVTGRYIRFSRLLSLMDDLDEDSAIRKMNGYIRMDSLTRDSGNEYLKKYRNMYNKFIQKFNVRKINHKTQKTKKSKKFINLRISP